MTLASPVADKLTRACWQDPNDYHVEHTNEVVCACLKAGHKESYATHCLSESSGFQGEQSRLRSNLHANMPIDFTDDECIEHLTERYLHMYAADLLQTCQKADWQVFSNANFVETAQSCWRLIDIDSDGCLVAKPCDRGVSLLSDLPISNQSFQTTPKATFEPEEALRLCHPRLSILMRLKDPKHLQKGYFNPFVNALGFGHINNHQIYGPMNCHGTAAFLTTDALDYLKVDKLNFWSPKIRATCHDTATAWLEHRFYDRDVSRTKAGMYSSFAQHSINMSHTKNCDTHSCGNTELMVTGCTDQDIEYYFFTQGMCVQCWKQLYLDSGFHEVNKPHQSWRDLTPGCVLTTEDHSVVLLMQNQGMCYYFESTTPYGPPQLRVDSCNKLWLTYDHRLCPSEPLSFNLGKR